MRCALINTLNNIVENIIIANPSTDPAPNGYILVGLDDNSQVSVGWSYDPSTGEFSPPAGEFSPPAEPVIEGDV